MALNLKSTIYTQSLVNFLLDTKPYSRKLTEINEIYKLNESMTVSFNDELFTGTTLKSVWPYTFFSSGTASTQPLKFKRISNYQDYGKYVNNQQAYSRGAFKIGRDESASLGSVSNTFDPKALGGVGLKDSYIQRSGDPSDVRYLTEGIDLHLSKGSYSFQIKQINGSNVSGTFIKTYDDTDGPFPIDVIINFSYDELVLSGPVSQLNATTLRVVAPGEVRAYGTVIGGLYNPQIKELKNEAVIAAAQQGSAALAYDDSVSYSAISQITEILNAIQVVLDANPNTDAQDELDSLFSVLEIPQLPYSYDDLIGKLISASVSVINGYATWSDVGTKLQALSPRILFNDFTDFTLRESGKLFYENLLSNSIVISNIEANANRENYEEITLTALSDTQILVSGNASGNLGIAIIGSRFETSTISFDVAAGVDSLSIGDIFTITPNAKITVSKNATQQSWSIIKTNPLAYSRPIYTSPTNAYAKIISLDNKEGYVTFLDIDFPSGKLELEVISATQLRLICEEEPEYSPIITVNQVFNDGRLGFTVINGTFAPLLIGDRIIMRVLNLPPQVEGLDLYFGYDVDPYDANNLVYNNVTSAIENYLVTLDFGYDSRFIGYDLSSFNLVVDGNAVSGRSWRLRALADLSRPLLMPSSIVNLLGTDDPTNPVALAKYDSDNNVTSEGIQSSTDIDTLDDLQLWYADRFALEYQDGEAEAWQLVNANIQIGQRYTFIDHGLSFTVVPAAKPFIASRSTSSRYINTIGGTVTSIVDGGDTIHFSIVNPDPILETPASIVSGTPRLILYGEHFYKCDSAFWTITKVDSGFTLQGRYTETNLNVYPSPLLLTTEDGLSYHIKEHNLHFTIVTSRGIANNDTFTFSTFADAPIFLVHGSVTGWSTPAKLNQWYWNGEIGFKIKPAECHLFVDGILQDGIDNWVFDFGTVELSYLSDDVSDCVITITSRENGVWLAYKDGNFIGSGINQINTDIFSITLPEVITNEVSLVLQIKGISHDFALGKDLVILNDKSERFPAADDFLVIERIETDEVQLAIKSLNSTHAELLKNLGAQTIDIRFTGSTSSLTSPELNILANWVPLTVNFKGPSGNEVPFGDISTNIELVSPISLEKIADIRALGSNLDEDVYIFWDTDFYNSYMPLNSESIAFAKSSGFNERVHVSVSETLNFLISAAGLNESTLFSDIVSVSIEEIAQIALGINYTDIISVATIDGPFTGFMPGFDNLPYDYETLIGSLNGEGGGYYDAGVPLTVHFERAKTLSLLQLITPQEQLELNNLLGSINAYLINGDIDQTTIADFISLVNADVSVNSIPTNYGFGFPDRGMATSVKENSTSLASSSIVDFVTLLSRNPGTPYDVRGYDVGLYDEFASSTTLLAATKSDIFKTITIGSTFEDYDTDLYALANTENIQIDFDSDIAGYPDIYVWENDWAHPVKAYYEKVSSKRFALSVAGADEIKLSIIASPLELFANNEPGVWYDPSDIKLGWRYNLLTKTEQFDDAVWGKFNATVTANAATAPDGTMTADKLVENTSTATRHYVATTASGATFPARLSVWMKAAERNYGFIGDGLAGPVAVVNLTDGSIVSSNASYAPITVRNDENGWFNVSITKPSVGVGAHFWAGAADNSGNPIYTGDGTSGIYIWGASLTTAENADRPYQKITDGIQDYYSYQAKPVMFQDSAGTTPVTAVEQPVGLILDKSKGLVLGPELVTNGDFSNGTAGWNLSPGWTLDSGVVRRVTGQDASGAVLSPVSGFIQAGKSYLVQWTRAGTAANGIKVRAYTAAAGGGTLFYNLEYQDRLGAQRHIFTAAQNGWVALWCYNDSSDITIDNISVRELPGNHATQTTSTSRPVLSARYNQLTKTEQFDDAVWMKTNATVSTNILTSPFNTLTADKVVESTANGEHFIRSSNIALNPGIYSYSIYWNSNSQRNIALSILHTSEANQTSSVTFYKDTLQLSEISGNAISALSENIGNDWWKISLTFSLTLSGNVQPTVQLVSSSNSYTGDGSSGIIIWGASLLPENQSMIRYQRVNTATDYDVIGFAPYLKSDGADDFMVTNNINFTSTDKATIFAGIRKNSNSASVIAELSSNINTNAGSFSLISGEQNDGRYSTISRGSAAINTNQQSIFNLSGYAPDAAVISASHDIFGDLSTIRRNSEDGIPASGDKGAGNFGNYPLYLFRRGDATLPFSGNLYSLIITGKEVPQDQLLAFESWVNQKTFAYSSPVIINSDVIGF